MVTSDFHVDLTDVKAASSNCQNEPSEQASTPSTKKLSHVFLDVFRTSHVRIEMSDPNEQSFRFDLQKAAGIQSVDEQSGIADRASLSEVRGKQQTSLHVCLPAQVANMVFLAINLALFKAPLDRLLQSVSRVSEDHTGF